MDARARLSILVVAGALGAWAGIRAHDRATKAAVDTPAVEAPVPAPANLIAEATLVAPDATWRKAQVGVGGIVLLAPATFGGLVAAMAREPSLGAVIDGGAPAFGALGAGGAWLIAAHVVSPQRARSTLTGESQAALPVAGRAGTIELLHAQGAWIGLAGSFVLVGSDRAAIETLGPYAYRTLPTQPLPQSALGASMQHAALDGPVRDALQRRWADFDRFLIAKDDEQRERHGGREPDLADPKVVVGELDAIEKTYEDRIAGMDTAEVALDVDDDGFHLRVTASAPHDGDVARWVASLGGGSTAPLAASGQDSLATFFWRSDEGDRQRAAKETADTLTRALGARVPPAEEAKLAEDLSSIAAGRGDWALASIDGGARAGLLLRFASGDPPALAASLASVIDLARKPTLSKWEGDALGLTKVERDGDRATFTTATGAFQATWAARGGEVDFAAGFDAASVLAAATPATTLSADTKVSAWLASLHANVVWALVARPLLFSSSPRSDA
ncbi:MAG TPA: hypothetical protein VGH28_17220, partial [Polyangiaceae bacterium]